MTGLQRWQVPPPGLPVALVEVARALAARQGCSLVQALRQAAPWEPGQLLATLASGFSYRACDAQDLQCLRAEFGVIDHPDCQARGLVLARDAMGTALLVLSDPFDGAAEQWARQRCHAVGVTPWPALAEPEVLASFLAQQEGAVRAMDDVAVGGAAGGSDGDGPATVITLASLRDDSNAVVRLVNSTLFDALRLGASDIHLECDSAGLRVLYRIDGVLVPVTTAHGTELARQAVSRIKVMAELDIAESRIPQDGRFRARIDGREVDLRVSVMPNLAGEDAVLRLLDRDALGRQADAPSLDRLGLPATAAQAIRALAARPHGMLLVTGPTGSGKTTTLYAALMEIQTGRDKIITIEDPVEYRLPQVLQIPVNEKKGLGFARGLRSILRHDPDKIMVGEIRDGETAQIAVQAALTGHLLLSTVHANSVFDVLGRFLHMGMDAYTLAAALNGVVAQRLVRKVCPHCAQPQAASVALLQAAGLTAAQLGAALQWPLRSGRGCASCRGTGYLGRRCAAEVLVLDDTLRDMIAAMAPHSALRAHAAQLGMVPLRDSLLEWVAAGETTLEEVVRVAG